MYDVRSEFEHITERFSLLACQRYSCLADLNKNTLIVIFSHPDTHIDLDSLQKFKTFINNFKTCFSSIHQQQLSNMNT